VQKALLLKFLVIGVVFLLLQIPLQMIGGLIHERNARQINVTEEIAASSFGRQQLAGPVLTLPYVEEYDVLVGDERQRHVEHRREERQLTLFPETLDIGGDVDVNTKHRGLFKVRVFEWRTRLAGRFAIKAGQPVPRTRSDSSITWGNATLAVGLGDPRGLVETPVLEWNGRPTTIDRGSNLVALPAGVHAQLGVIDPTHPATLPFTLGVVLQGTQSLAILPLADTSHITLASSWPNPSFAGQFLPRGSSRGEAAGGFAAEWTITSLASNAQQTLLRAIDSRSQCSGGQCGDRIEVNFIDPIDIYSLTDRAQKYGFLFIGIGFGAFLLIELLRAAPIHPAQYGLVGLAMATFFLLLLGLSEHVRFGLAYLAAASACVIQLGTYLAAALGSRRLGLALGILLALLFAALYVLLVSEDNALLLGSVLVFALVSGALAMTRRLDWYGLAAGRSPAA
jgi:inner membrane protein